MQQLTESVAAIVELSRHQAISLNALGKRLASSALYWDATVEASPDRTVIRVNPVDQTRWEVRIADAVGALSVGDAQFLVSAKVPNPHLPICSPGRADSRA